MNKLGLFVGGALALCLGGPGNAVADEKERYEYQSFLCRSDVSFDPKSGDLSYDSNCPNVLDGLLAMVAKDKALAARMADVHTMTTPRETSLLYSGLFDACALLGTLAVDPEWLAPIPHPKWAMPVLKSILPDAGLSPDFTAFLAGYGLRATEVDLDELQLSDGPTASALDCKVVPAKVPKTAHLWMKLEPL